MRAWVALLGLCWMPGGALAAGGEGQVTWVVMHGHHHDAVLGALPAGSFTLRYRMEALPMLTGVATPEAVAVLRAHPAVRALGPDVRVSGSAAKAVAHVGALDVQADTGLTGLGVSVALLDTGVDMDHVDFDNRLVVGHRFLNQGADVGASEALVQDNHGHGTHVAGLIASSGAISPVGAAPETHLVVYKVLDANNVGWASDWAAAVDHLLLSMADWPAEVPPVRLLSMSLTTNKTFDTCPCVGSEEEGAWSVALDVAMAAAADAGLLSVAAAGNSGVSGALPMPACLASVVAVGAVHDEAVDRWPEIGTYQNAVSSGLASCYDDDVLPDSEACFTNRNACLELMAPGVAVTGADKFGGATKTFTGTSQATPIVAGVAALMWQGNPDLTADEVRGLLASTGTPVAVEGLLASVPRVHAPAAVAGAGAVCGDGAVWFGEACDDGNADAMDCCADCEPVNEGIGCDDGLACTVEDICVAGVCEGQPQVCDDGNPCTVDACSEEAGGCVADAAASDGASCDDGDACTDTDECAEGTCAGTPVDCGPVAPCTTQTCVSGSCVVSVLACDDGDPCSADGCSVATGGCVHDWVANDGLDCDDGDLCTVEDRCQGGACVGQPVECVAGQPCSLGECLAETGACHFVEHTGDCDDGDPCTEADSCASGTCLGVLLTCDDGDPCTQDDSCSADGGCVGQPIDCGDGNPCTDDLCVTDSGGCIHLVLGLNGSACDDGDVCTVTDVCSGGLCLGLSVTCDDDNPCTDDTCDPETGSCAFNGLPLSEQPCDDGKYCTVQDVCDGQGECEGVPRTCAVPSEAVCWEGACFEPEGRCVLNPRPSGVTCGADAQCLDGLNLGKAVCDGAGGCAPQTIEACDSGQCDSSGLACAAPVAPPETGCEAAGRGGPGLPLDWGLGGLLGVLYALRLSSQRRV